MSIDPDDFAEEVSEDTIDLAADSLTGDIRDTMLEWFRHRPKPWQQMSEAEQRNLAQEADHKARALVGKAVRLIAGDGRNVVTATLDQVTVKNGIKAALSIDRHSEHRHDLVDAQGKVVLLMVADDKPYQGERRPVQVDRDQPGLPLGGGNDTADDKPVFDGTDAGKGVAAERHDPSAPSVPPAPPVVAAAPPKPVDWPKSKVDQTKILDAYVSIGSRNDCVVLAAWGAKLVFAAHDHAYTVAEVMGRQPLELPDGAGGFIGWVEFPIGELGDVMAALNKAGYGVIAYKGGTDVAESWPLAVLEAQVEDGEAQPDLAGGEGAGDPPPPGAAMFDVNGQHPVA